MFQTQTYIFISRADYCSSGSAFVCRIIHDAKAEVTRELGPCTHLDSRHCSSTSGGGGLYSLRRLADYRQETRAGSCCNCKTRRSYSEGGTTFLLSTRGRPRVCVKERGASGRAGPSNRSTQAARVQEKKFLLCFLALVLDNHFRK